MATKYINSISDSTNTYKFVDDSSGYSKTGVYIQDLFSTVNETALGAAYENGDVILGHYAGPQGENWFYNLVYYQGSGFLIFSRIQDSMGPNPHETWSSDQLIDVVEYSTYANPQWTQRSLPLITDIKVNNTSVISTDSTGITSANIVTGTDYPYDASTNPLATLGDIGASGGGTVTSVGLTGATNSGLTISGSPVTTSGNITVGHTNVLDSAQNVLAVYPIKIDKNGHISDYGSAVSVNTLCWYGTCATTDSTSSKTVNCSGYTLSKGNIIGVLFSTANTASTPTLNVNSTGDKSIYIGNSVPSTNENPFNWSANTMIYFMYDGTYYRYMYAVASAKTTPPRGANTWYGTSNTEAATQTKVSTIDNFVLTKGALVSITFSTANTYTSGSVRLNISSTLAKSVYYNGAVTSSSNTLLWDANTTLTFVYDGTGYIYLGSSKDTVTDVQIGGTSILNSGIANIVTNSTYNSSSNKIATMSDVPTVNDGALKLQKNTGTATSVYTANQSGDTTLKWTTTSVGSASGWSAGTMASIDTTKFSGGSFTQGTDSFTAATHGADSFTAATMTSTAGSTSTSVTNPTTLTISFSGGSFSSGAFSGGSFTQGTDSHTAASLSSGFYSAGTAPSLTVTSTTVMNDLSKV